MGADTPYLGFHTNEKGEWIVKAENRLCSDVAKKNRKQAALLGLVIEILLNPELANKESASHSSLELSSEDPRLKNDPFRKHLRAVKDESQLDKKEKALRIIALFNNHQAKQCLSDELTIGERALFIDALKAHVEAHLINQDLLVEPLLHPKKRVPDLKLPTEVEERTGRRVSDGRREKRLKESFSPPRAKSSFSPRRLKTSASPPPKDKKEVKRQGTSLSVSSKKNEDDLISKQEAFFNQASLSHLDYCQSFWMSASKDSRYHEMLESDVLLSPSINKTLPLMLKKRLFDLNSKGANVNYHAWAQNVDRLLLRISAKREGIQKMEAVFQLDPAREKWSENGKFQEKVQRFLALLKILNDCVGGKEQKIEELWASSAKGLITNSDSEKKTNQSFFEICKLFLEKMVNKRNILVPLLQLINQEVYTYPALTMSQLLHPVRLANLDDHPNRLFEFNIFKNREIAFFSFYSSIAENAEACLGCMPFRIESITSFTSHLDNLNEWKPSVQYQFYVERPSAKFQEELTRLKLLGVEFKVIPVFAPIVKEKRIKKPLLSTD